MSWELLFAKLKHPEVRERFKSETQIEHPEFRIKLFRAIRSDIPIPPVARADPGVYIPWSNPRGAISVKTSSGELLGLKPAEFDWVQTETGEQ